MLSIWTNMSKSEKEKTIKATIDPTKKQPYIPVSNCVCSNRHWIIFSDDARKIEEGGFNPFKFVDPAKYTADDFTVEIPTLDQIKRTAALGKIVNNPYPPVKIGPVYINAHYLLLAYTVFKKNKLVGRIQNKPNDDGAINKPLVISDGGLHFAVMPLRPEKDDVTSKEADFYVKAKAEEIARAQKMKSYITKSCGKSPKLRGIYEDAQNIALIYAHKDKDSKSMYFVTFNKTSDFYKRVFDFSPEDSYTEKAPELVVDQERTALVEDLFHRRILYAKNNNKIWHFYENNCGIIFYK